MHPCARGANSVVIVVQSLFSLIWLLKKLQTFTLYVSYHCNSSNSYQRKPTVNFVPKFLGRHLDCILMPRKQMGLPICQSRSRQSSLHGAKASYRIPCRVGTTVRARHAGAAVCATQSGYPCLRRPVQLLLDRRLVARS